MKRVTFLAILLLLNSCLATKGSNKRECDENQIFRNIFFDAIRKVENDMLGKGEPGDYNEGLDFIDDYTKVSYDKMLNYSRSYTTMKEFEKDKKVWLRWYNKNKCYNLQVK